jgi:hypothetical protein
MIGIEFWIAYFVATFIIGVPMKWAVYTRLDPNRSSNRFLMVGTVAAVASLTFAVAIVPLHFLLTDSVIPLAEVAGLDEGALMLLGAGGVMAIATVVAPALGAWAERSMLTKIWNQDVSRESFKSLWKWNVLVVTLGAALASAID